MEPPGTVHRGQCRGAPRAEHGEPVEIEVDGIGIEVTNPGKVFFAGRGGDEARSGPLLRAGRGGGAARRLPAADGDEALSRRGGRQVVLPKARAQGERPVWLETATVHFPSGRSAEEVCPATVAHLAWMANLGCIDLNPWPVRRGTSTTPTSCGWTSTPRRGCPSPPCAPWPWRSTRCWPSTGCEEFPKTSGSRGIPASTSASRPSLRLHRGAAGGAGAGPGAGASPARHRHRGLVEGGAGAPGAGRLQPECPGPHRLSLGLLSACVPSPTPGCRAR